MSKAKTSKKGKTIEQQGPPEPKQKTKLKITLDGLGVSQYALRQAIWNHFGINYFASRITAYCNNPKKKMNTETAAVISKTLSIMTKRKVYIDDVVDTDMLVKEAKERYEQTWGKVE